MYPVLCWMEDTKGKTYFLALKELIRSLFCERQLSWDGWLISETILEYEGPFVYF